jgi:Fe-S-cluster containining protein
MGENEKRVLSECSTCEHQLCCRVLAIKLTGDEINRQKYKAVFCGEDYWLPRRIDGSCLFLRAGWCSIYQDRPKMCGEYECGGDERIESLKLCYRMKRRRVLIKQEKIE